MNPCHLLGMQSASLPALSRVRRAAEPIMSRHRGGGRIAKRTRHPHASLPLRAIHLSPGVRIDGGPQDASFVLVCEGRSIHLNHPALTVLKLCDGSRDRHAIVSELPRDSDRHALRTEIVEFLEAALAAGWIMEAEPRTE